MHGSPGTPKREFRFEEGIGIGERWEADESNPADELLISKT